MSKIVSPEALLKRATSLEKLALFSDRKSFLKALAQGFTPDEIKQYENTDEFGKPKTHLSYPPVPKKEEDGFSQDELNQWNDTDAFGNPNAHGVPAAPAAKPSVEQKTKQHTKPTLTAKTWAKQLIDTVNNYINKAGPQTAQNMMDPKREAFAKQLDDHAISELVRLYDQTGGVNNPYADADDQALAEAIKNTVENFGKAFSGQISTLKNYNKLGK